LTDFKLVSLSESAERFYAPWLSRDYGAL